MSILERVKVGLSNGTTALIKTAKENAAGAATTAGLLTVVTMAFSGPAALPKNGASVLGADALAEDHNRLRFLALGFVGVCAGRGLMNTLVGTKDFVAAVYTRLKAPASSAPTVETRLVDSEKGFRSGTPTAPGN